MTGTEVEATDATPRSPYARRGSPRSRLNRAAVRLPLILDLASGEKSQDALAEQYGVDQGSISRFALRFAAEIEAQRADMENKFAALWIAQKAARLAAYEDDVEAIDDHHDQPETALDPALLGAKHRALRNTAEELGALRTVIDSTVSVRYEIVGVDPEALR
jgi:hypothetical protein